MIYRVHTANALSILANSLVSMVGRKLEYPMYTDLIGLGKTQTADTRTAEEIKRDILRGLGR